MEVLRCHHVACDYICMCSYHLLKHQIYFYKIWCVCYVSEGLQRPRARSFAAYSFMSVTDQHLKLYMKICYDDKSQTYLQTVREVTCAS